MVRYANIVFNGLYLVTAYIESLISRVCYFFSHFDVSMNCKSWICKSHNIFLRCPEIEAISMFEGF